MAAEMGAQERRRLRRTDWLHLLLAGAATCLALSIAVPAAQAQTLQHFTIPAQPAETALRSLAAQSGRQILFPFEAVTGRQAAPLVGAFTLRQAAERLAASVGLTVRSIDERTITLAFIPLPASREGAAPAARAAAVPPVLLQELVVTATLKSEPISRAPLAVSAKSQSQLDELRVRTLEDMQTIAPSLHVTSSGGTAVAYPAIRGVVGSGVGVSATTGVYVDDTPLQKRNPGGGSNAGYANGTPIPPIFDLERMEVLRGPQGTLFGSGSQGGTVRFIMAAPSLTDTTAYVRSGLSSTQWGGVSGELGAAVGGPLVEGKLGFRASGLVRRTAGWIDLIDRFTGAVKDRDANEARARSARLVLTWAPAEAATVTLSHIVSRERFDDVVANTSLSTTQPIVEPTQCYRNAGVTAANPVAYPEPVGFGDQVCAQMTALGQADFTRPGATYGPFSLGPDDRIGQPDFTWPATFKMNVTALTLNYDFGPVVLRSIGSYVQDRANQRGGSGTYVSISRNANAAYGDITINRGLDIVSVCRDACLAAAHLDTRQRHWGLTQEIRLSSAPGDGRFNWVAGGFYSQQRIKQEQYASITDEQSLRVFGLTTAQRFGVAPFVMPNGTASGYTFLNNTYDDAEAAVFGEASLWALDRLRLTVGLRLSRFDSSFGQVTFGPATGFSVPTRANGGLTSGQTQDTTLTPRFSAQYQMSAHGSVYASVAKGYRAGGANPPLPEGQCGAALAVYGARVEDIPTTYRSDTVWNYEAGAKLRVLRKAQVNASAYRIDWSDMQLSASLNTPCGIPFIQNSGRARIDGLELEVEARLAPRLIAEVVLARTNARHLDDSLGLPVSRATLDAPTLISAVAGQKLAVSPFTLNLALRHEFTLGETTVHVRGQYRYLAAARGTNTSIYGGSFYTPDRIEQDAQRIDLRVGFQRGGAELSLYANNLLNNRDGYGTGGRAACANPAEGGTAACESFGRYVADYRLRSTFTPREIGLQLIYRR